MTFNANYPTWEELPQLDLYLDQVLIYVNQVCLEHFSLQDKGLTAAMVNNYVKLGSLSKPVKKKYNRQQIARLIVLTTLKPVFAIQEISPVLNRLTADNKSSIMYNYFVEAMCENSNGQIPEIISQACQTLISYRKTYQLLQEMETSTDEN